MCVCVCEGGGSCVCVCVCVCACLCVSLLECVSTEGTEHSQKRSRKLTVSVRWCSQAPDYGSIEKKKKNYYSLCVWWPCPPECLLFKHRPPSRTFLPCENGGGRTAKGKESKVQLVFCACRDVVLSDWSGAIACISPPSVCLCVQASEFCQMPAALLSVQARPVLLRCVGQTVYHTPLAKRLGSCTSDSKHSRTHTHTTTHTLCQWTVFEHTCMDFMVLSY